MRGPQVGRDRRAVPWRRLDGTFELATAERPGGHGPSEDRIVVVGRTVVVIDGATQAVPLTRSGGWLADRLGRALAVRLEHTQSQALASVLHDAIAEVVAEHGLVRGEAPSATVSIVRFGPAEVDVLVLCDSPVMVATVDGRIEPVRDDRIDDAVASVELPPGRRDLSDQRWRAAVEAVETRRNRPGGFWCVSASPEAAWEAVNRSFPVGEVRAVALMTDGVSVGVDRYRTPPDWNEAIELALDDPEALVNLVHATEEGDPDAQRWRRSKRHDDKAIAVARRRASTR